MFLGSTSMVYGRLGAQMLSAVQLSASIICRRKVRAREGSTQSLSVCMSSYLHLHPYLPLNTGFLFSPNACSASVRSFVGITVS